MLSLTSNFQLNFTTHMFSPGDEYKYMLHMK